MHEVVILGLLKISCMLKKMTRIWNNTKLVMNLLLFPLHVSPGLDSSQCTTWKWGLSRYRETWEEFPLWFLKKVSVVLCWDNSTKINFPSLTHATIIYWILTMSQVLFLVLSQVRINTYNRQRSLDLTF